MCFGLYIINIILKYFDYKNIEFTLKLMFFGLDNHESCPCFRGLKCYSDQNHSSVG